MSISSCSHSAASSVDPIQTQICSNINQKRDLFSFFKFFSLPFFLSIEVLTNCFLGHHVDLHNFKENL